MMDKCKIIEELIIDCDVEELSKIERLIKEKRENVEIMKISTIIYNNRILNIIDNINEVLTFKDDNGLFGIQTYEHIMRSPYMLFTYCRKIAVAMEKEVAEKVADRVNHLIEVNKRVQEYYNSKKES